jgi:hypothetical protein
MKSWVNALRASDLMKLIWLFRNETDTYVWLILLKHIQPLAQALLNTDLYSDFRIFFKNLLENMSKKLGFELKSDEG